jgi:ribonuclease Z
MDQSMDRQIMVNPLKEPKEEKKESPKKGSGQEKENSPKKGSRQEKENSPKKGSGKEHKSCKLVYNLSITGVSVAATETAYMLEGLTGFLFDAGRKLSNKIHKVIAITHCHGDHIKGLSDVLEEPVQKGKKVVILVPTESKKDVENFVSSYFTMTKNRPPFGKKVLRENVELVGMDHKSIYRFKDGNQLWQYETVQCDHSVPTVGYLFSEVVNKLKPEYVGLEQSALNELCANKVTIREELVKPVFAYICDTSIKTLSNNPHIFSMPVVMVECTFFKSDDYKNAGKKKHIHWNDLEKFVEEYKDTRFVLFHPSARYMPTELDEFTREQQKKYSNLVGFI